MSQMLIKLTELIPNCEGVSDYSTWYEILLRDGRRRPATREEIDAATARASEEIASKEEISTAREDAKNALAQLQAIMEEREIPTLIGITAAVRALAAIQIHAILATLGR